MKKKEEAEIIQTFTKGIEELKTQFEEDLKTYKDLRTGRIYKCTRFDYYNKRG